MRKHLWCCFVQTLCESSVIVRAGWSVLRPSCDVKNSRVSVSAVWKPPPRSVCFLKTLIASSLPGSRTSPVCAVGWEALNLNFLPSTDQLRVKPQASAYTSAQVPATPPAPVADQPDRPSPGSRASGSQGLRHICAQIKKQEEEREQQKRRAGWAAVGAAPLRPPLLTCWWS